MNRLKRTVCVHMLACFLLLLAGASSAAENGNEDTLTARVIGAVPLEKSGVTPHILKQVDRLVPVLKKVPLDKIIRLDCTYTGDASREADVRAAYGAAGRIEKYLRERHKLKLDLWVSAHLTPSKNNSKLVFSVLSDEINQYQKLPVNPGNERP